MKSQICTGLEVIIILKQNETISDIKNLKHIKASVFWVKKYLKRNRLQENKTKSKKLLIMHIKHFPQNKFPAVFIFKKKPIFQQISKEK